MTQFFGLSADQLTDTHCESEVQNVTNLATGSMDVHSLAEDNLDENHTFGAFWRKYGNDASNLDWLHLPEFDREIETEEEDTDQHSVYSSIIGLGDDTMSVLVQDVMLAEAKADILRSVMHFFGQTLVVVHVTHREQGRCREHRTSCAISKTGNFKLFLLVREEQF
ncbi:MAG: hypothetical protein NUV56_01375, partial [Candidatus Uhrbacteria bacterium]|nr:hypothetical protein [Candidatus Uhrbacteria bacterium]